MRILLFLLAVQSMVWLILWFRNRKAHRLFIAAHRKEIWFPFAAPAFVGCSERLNIRWFDRRIRLKMAQLHGGEDGEIPVRLFKLRMLTVLAFVSMFGTGIACVAGGDWLLFGCGLVFCILSPFLMLKDLDRQIRKRKQAFLYGLPELANNLLLLVNAGETVQQAIVRCAESGSGRADDPLFSELSRAVRELENRRPFQEVMEAFNKRCAVREVSMLTTTVLLNYRRGGNELVSALQQLSHELWERRKALAKTWGEEASSKLVFPMVVIFLVIMAIIAAPAVMMLHS